jgi:hypothetical protein
MKSITALYSMMAAFSSPLDMYHDHKTDIHGISSKTEEERKREKGMKKFIVGGREYWALNKKNAEKKHLKYLKSK